MFFISHVFFQKPELIRGLGSHAAHIEHTKVVRQFKDLFGIPVAEVSEVCWENFSLRVLLGSQFP